MSCERNPRPSCSAYKTEFALLLNVVEASDSRSDTAPSGMTEIKRSEAGIFS